MRQHRPALVAHAERDIGRYFTDGSSKSPSNDCTTPAESRLSLLGAKDFTDSKGHTYRHAQANQVSDKLY